MTIADKCFIMLLFLDYCWATNEEQEVGEFGHFLQAVGGVTSENPGNPELHINSKKIDFRNTNRPAFSEVHIV